MSTQFTRDSTTQRLLHEQSAAHAKGRRTHRNTQTLCKTRPVALNPGERKVLI